MELQTAVRYRLLDELRGLDLISMMLYHGMWDVVFLFGVAQKWYTGRPGFVWQQSICWVFILLSGFFDVCQVRLQPGDLTVLLCDFLVIPFFELKVFVLVYNSFFKPVIQAEFRFG